MAASRRPWASPKARHAFWRAPASDEVHLLVVMTAERGLCGGFNSTIVQAGAAAHRQPEGRGQDGEDPDRRQEGPGRS
jgi:F0F1-type ATP synthase gamma subunit